MPLSLIFFTVSILMVTGVISLTDAFIRLLLNPKSSPKSVIIYCADSPETIEYHIKKIIKKYPYSKISVNLPPSASDSSKIAEIIKKDYPYISITNTF